MAYESISSFLQNKRNIALHKAITAMDNKADIQCNKFMHLENPMLMYGGYNVETLEKLIKTVCNIHNTTTLHEKAYSQGQYPALLYLKHSMHIF